MSMRPGFTAIELLTVLAVASILIAMAAPGVAQAQRVSRVGAGAEAIQRVAAQAQVQARARRLALRGADAGRHFGVAILPGVGGSPARAVMLFGMSSADVWRDDQGRAMGEQVLPAQVMPVMGRGGALEPITAPVAWFYRFGTGEPIIDSNGDGVLADEPVAPIGTPGVAARPGERVTLANGENHWMRPDLPMVPPSPLCTALEVRSLDARIRIAIAVYAPGILNAERL